MVITLDETYYDELMLNFGKPSRINHADGYVSLDENGNTTFYYYLKDHLGNVRSVITPDTDGKPIVVQANDYFPFGMSFESPIPHLSYKSTTTNKHKYNGKEEQEMPGKWLDYGFRFYDPQLGRFPSVDPIIEKFPYLTPFNYASNNPITNIDLWGLQGVNSNAVKANWMRNNPMGAIQEGFRQIFDAAASLFTVSASVNIKSTTTVASANGMNASVTSTIETESKAEIKVDGSGIFDYYGQNSLDASQLNPFSVETSTTTKTVQEVKATVNVDGVPVNISNSQEQSSNGETKSTIEGSVGVSKKNVSANVYVNTSTATSSDGSTSSSAAAGVKASVPIAKTGNTTTTAGAQIEIERKKP